MENLMLETITKPTSKAIVERLANIAVEQKTLIPYLLELAFNNNDQLAFRAAWVLETAFIQDRLVFTNYLDGFLVVYGQQQNQSAKRHFAKILALATKKNASVVVQNIIINYNEIEALIAINFDWLIDPETPVAVKSHCLDILANLSRHHPWVKEELLQTIDFLVDKESIAFFAKAKMVRKRLR